MIEDQKTEIGRVLARAGAVLALALLVTSALACGSEPSPGQAAPAPAAKPPSPASAPPPAPTPPPVEVPENCDLVVTGDRDVERALLDTRSGRLQKVEVVDGRTLKIVCPDREDDQKGALVIAELEPDETGVRTAENIRSWEVDLSADSKPADLKIEDAKVGIPPLNEEDMALFEEEWGNEWAEAETGEEDAPANVPKKKAPPKVAVEFNAGRLRWVELRYQSEETKRSKEVTLSPTANRKLEAGRYKLWVRYPETKEWKDAGMLELTPSMVKAKVKLKESPKLEAVVVIERAM